MPSLREKLTESEIAKIVHFLNKTDMTIPEIAARMNRSRGIINSLNRQYKIRNYNGLRSSWTVNHSSEESKKAD